MKTAIILNGSLNSIKKQAEELNSYISRNLPTDDEIEAWILSDQEIDFKIFAFSHHIKRIKSVQVKTKHVAEEYLDAITKMYELNKPQLMIFGSELFVSGLSVRTAFRLKGTSCVGVRNNRYEEGYFVIDKLVYSNNLTARLKMKNIPYCISIAKGFRDEIEILSSLPEVEKIIFPSSIKTDWLHSDKLELVETEDGLKTAKIVVTVGKGIGSKEKIALFEELANLFGGKLGASRPVVMNAWTSMERLVGVSGSIISPDVCIAIGVSGSAAFNIGIEKSKFIVAVNQDEKAPIFKIADVAICSEYQEIVDELIKLLKLR